MKTLLSNNIEKSISSYDFNNGLKLVDLPIAEQENLFQRGSTVELSKKEVLFQEGDTPKGVYILISGKLKLSQLSKDGAEQIIFIYSEGTIFGHRPILGGDKIPTTAVALEPCKLLFIEKEHFMKALDNSIEFSRVVMQSTCHEFMLLVNRINVFAQKGIKERLALFLLLLNETYKTNGQTGRQSEIVINRNDLAGYVGTSVENLVRSLRVLKENNFVSTKGKSIFINDFEELYEMSKL